MSFVDQLNDASSGSQPTLQSFLLSKSPDQYVVHAFHEGGDDPSFYSNFILDHKDDSWKLNQYACGGKDEVYETYQKVIPKSDESEYILFFVDKDLEDVIPVDRPDHDEIFTTKYYSIENYLVTELVLRRVLSEIFRIESSNPVTDEIVTQFEAIYDQFCDILRLISAWVVFLYREDENPQLSNANLDSLFKITEDLRFRTRLNEDNLIERMELMCNTNTPNKWNREKSNILDELSDYSIKEVSRGKYELWLLVKFINKLPEVLSDSDTQYSQNTNIHSSNAVEVLAPRIGSIPRLEDYLDSRIT